MQLAQQKITNRTGNLIIKPYTIEEICLKLKKKKVVAAYRLEAT
jgi:predicted nucleic acid-binding protein